MAVWPESAPSTGLQLVERSSAEEFSDVPEITVFPAPDDIHFSVEQIVNFEVSLVKGLIRGGLSQARLHLLPHGSDNTGRGIETRIISAQDSERLALVTEPDPELGYNPAEAINYVFIPGLGEIDCGPYDSSTINRLHVEFADRHPDARTVTLTNPGVSHSGPTTSITEGWNKTTEAIAEQNLSLVASLAGDADVEFILTSLGTNIGAHAAYKNISRHAGAVINLGGLTLFSSAVGARNVPEDKKLTEFDASDEDFIDGVTREFFLHMPGDVLRMLKRNPEIATESLVGFVAYALAIHKAPRRIAAIGGNLRSAQKGIEYDHLSAVTETLPVSVVSGADDPLWIAQKPQWLSLSENARRLKLHELEGFGHALTVDSELAVDHFDLTRPLAVV
ncbi:MAG: hypothetical protein ACHQT9_01055 [Candidatus Saccharimonadales bacterium]